MGQGSLNPCSLRRHDRAAALLLAAGLQTCTAMKTVDYPVVAQERLAGDYQALSACVYDWLERSYQAVFRYTTIAADNEARLSREVGIGGGGVVTIWEARFRSAGNRSTLLTLRYNPRTLGQAADIRSIVDTARMCQ